MSDSKITAVERQIALLEKGPAAQITLDDANEIISSLGGARVLGPEDDVPGACYYMTLLSIRKMHEAGGNK